MRLFFLLFSIAISATAVGQLKKAAIKDLSFIAGQWTLQHEWGDMEEVWSAPMGNNMMGSYRCVKDSKIVFYEFMVIEQTDSVPVLYLRHFGAGSIAWEEKESPGLYPLLLLEGRKAQFRKEDGRTMLTFIRQSPTQLQVLLDSSDGGEKPKKVVFNYRLKGG
jgi:hypothetical protein